MPSRFAIGLQAGEVVDRRGDGLPSPLVGADCIHLMTDGKQQLEGYHGFIVFDEVTDENQ